MNARYLLVAVVLLVGPGLARAQDGVIRAISDERLEAILGDLRIEFTRDSSEEGTTTWLYTRNNLKMRLTNFKGKDLMIDAEFGKATLEAINEWNTKVKFTRANLRKGGKGAEFARLESNLDLAGGVSETAVKRFIDNFDLDVRAFAQTLFSAASEEEIYRPVTSLQLDLILKSLKIEFKKEEAKNGTVFYNFERFNHAIELTNYSGKDVMIAARFDKAPLTKVNKWNLDRKFVRAVLYPGRGNPDYVALESNLDCAAGCSESMMRSFITAFDFEVREFKKFLSARGPGPAPADVLVRPNVDNAKPAKEDALKVFAWDEGKCSMLMPGQPQRQTSKFKTALGEDRELVMMILEEGIPSARGWALLMTDMPETRNADEETIEKMLDGGRDGAVQNVKGKVIREQQIKLDGKYTGRDIIVEGLGVNIRVRFFLVGERLYQTMVLGQRDYVTSAEANRILDSFKLLK